MSEMYAPTMTTDRRPIPGAFSFNPDKPLKRVQRLCLWVLERLGCQHSTEYKNYSRIEINLDSLFDMVLESADAVSALYGDAGYLVIGKEQMDRLLIESGDILRFNVPLNHEMSGEWRRGYAPTVAGLRIVMVPWFDGVVVLPKNI
jgi:hypothetical protein